MVAPAGATEDSPVLLFLHGNISLDEEPAPVGTEIVVKLNEDVVGSSSVYHEGLYGDEPNKRLSITCDPENYGNIKFYVNGNEAKIVNPADLENANSWNLIELDLIAESPADSNGGSSGGGSGGGSGVSTGTTNEDTAEPGGSGDDTGVNQQDTQPPEEISSSPDSESAGSKNNLSTTIILAVVIVIVALGALFYAKNKGL